MRKVPNVEWQESSTTRSLFYAGEPFEGKPTRVFACYATPGTLSGDPTKDKNLPGIVLVHGGGGKAFPRWAELWASRGYAAIAMDLSGSGKPHQPRTDAGPRQQDDVIFRTDAPATDQWSYHAVAAVIRAHSLLLSFPEVDAERTAITGISWGGYLTCIVAGLDDRFKAAIPVYGCGFIRQQLLARSFQKNARGKPQQLGASVGPFPIRWLRDHADVVRQWRQGLRLPAG